MKTFLVLWLLFWATVSNAQGPKGLPTVKPDLSGTWVLDLLSSNFGSPKGSPLYDELRLVILHRDPEIRILRNLKKKNRERSQMLIYYSDSRGETNPTMDGRENLKSKTHWEGVALVSSSRAYQDIPIGYTIKEITERWELAPDGNTLRQESFFQFSFVINGQVNPARPLKTLRVFKREP